MSWKDKLGYMLGVYSVATFRATATSTVRVKRSEMCDHCHNRGRYMAYFEEEGYYGMVPCFNCDTLIRDAFERVKGHECVMQCPECKELYFVTNYTSSGKTCDDCWNNRKRNVHLVKLAKPVDPEDPKKEEEATEAA